LPPFLRAYRIHESNNLTVFYSKYRVNVNDASMASTRTAAACIGLGTHLGTLDPGKWTDLLVVEDDPLADITILQQKERLRLVMKAGETAVNRPGVAQPARG